LLELPNFRGWENFPIPGELAEELGCAVSIDSNANVAALAEALFGAEKSTPLIRLSCGPWHGLGRRHHL
jgi:predicted NBD/HSP70 family sugar kinase